MADIYEYIGGASIMMGVDNYAMGNYSIAIGRPAMSGRFLYKREFKGITLNCDNALSHRTISEFVYFDYIDKIFTADVSVYEGVVQIYLTNSGYK